MNVCLSVRMAILGWICQRVLVVGRHYYYWAVSNDGRKGRGLCLMTRVASLEPAVGVELTGEGEVVLMVGCQSVAGSRGAVVVVVEHLSP